LLEDGIYWFKNQKHHTLLNMAKFNSLYRLARMISTGRIYKKSFLTIDTDRFLKYKYNRISIAALTN
jgi:hypothetical protein